jgi:class 3 adenylate cyclase
MQAWLEKSNGDRVELKEACVIGRSKKCQLRPDEDDEYVSGRHTLVYQQAEGEFWVVDFGSSNGTFHNGKRLLRPCRLRDGDTIKISTVVYRFGEARSPGGRGLRLDASERTLGPTDVFIEYRFFWLLLADIKGATPLSLTLPADKLSRLIGLWIRECMKDIESAGGAVNQILGDGIFAYLPECPDSAERARNLMIKLAARQAQSELPFRLVLHYGKLAVGGVSVSQEERLTGAEVNFLFRLESVIKALDARIGLSANAKKHWPNQGELVSLGKHLVRSFDGPHEVFALKR